MHAEVQNNTNMHLSEGLLGMEEVRSIVLLIHGRTKEWGRCQEFAECMAGCDVQEEMHLVWRGHWAWKRWQADKDRRHAIAANQPGTVEFEEYKVNEENNHTHAAITNGNHTLPKPV